MKKVIMIIITLVFIFMIPAKATENEIIVDAVEKQSKPQSDEITVEKLSNYFQTHAEMKKIVPYIVKGCKQENVSVVLITAIAIHESGWGRSRLAKEKKNYFGISAYDWDPYGNGADFSKYSLEEAIIESIKIIKQDYLIYGWTIDEIGKKYCPTDPNWSKHIQEIMEDITNEMQK